MNRAAEDESRRVVSERRRPARRLIVETAMSQAQINPMQDQIDAKSPLAALRPSVLMDAAAWSVACGGTGVAVWLDLHGPGGQFFPALAVGMWAIAGVLELLAVVMEASCDWRELSGGLKWAGLCALGCIFVLGHPADQQIRGLVIFASLAGGVLVLGHLSGRAYVPRVLTGAERVKDIASQSRKNHRIAVANCLLLVPIDMGLYAAGNAVLFHVLTGMLFLFLAYMAIHLWVVLFLAGRGKGAAR